MNNKRQEIIKEYKKYLEVLRKLKNEDLRKYYMEEKPKPKTK